MNPNAGVPKKRQRTAATRHYSSSTISSVSDITLTELSQSLHHRPSTSTTTFPTNDAFHFNDASTADVVLRLFIDAASPLETSTSVDSVSNSDLHVYLHSDILLRSKYFSALLSDRWIGHVPTHPPPPEHSPDDPDLFRLNLGVSPASGSIQSHLTVLELLYTNDFATAIDSASTALDLLPVALELLFEECVRWCVDFLEAVPWTEEEEKRVVSLIPFLSEEESKELVARVSPVGEDSSEAMLQGLISSAMNNYQNTAFVKAFVGKILRDLSSRETAKRVLEKAFKRSLKTVKESLEDYSSPVFRGDHNETEAIQRLNLHKASTNGKHLLWLVERMIELKVADVAVKEWSEQAPFTADLQRAFRDDAWRNIVPGLPAVILRCTCKLANAVSTGSILASRQVRRKLVEDWLPVLVVCKDNVSPISPSNKSLYLELEETFLRIISTLPMLDAQELLQRCLSFSTRNVEDCPHLVRAFNTWFRRAARPLKPDCLLDQ
ncbi:BTB/POZ domain-containing protein At1g63850-like [Abrus precatorius]|uniref:BTB/POZ domain-containing protein At1g63850-like n=1 Tax=Abrus precatorius TaxID=3816 RepID=A0A8B8LG98_ABRPR|nr:BTB/POZ domain-containing protein At1g63850-like [Abrus precatorius]